MGSRSDPVWDRLLAPSHDRAVRSRLSLASLRRPMSRQADGRTDGNHRAEVVGVLSCSLRVQGSNPSELVRKFVSVGAVIIHREVEGATDTFEVTVSGTRHH